jgi:carbon-monoxide dehydrogenase large subunit
MDDPSLLVRGAAPYVADLPHHDALHASFVRATLPHARIRRIDVDAACTAPGVVAVWTAHDLGLADVPGFELFPHAFSRPPLARDVVRFTGEALAIVLATSPAEADDAAGLVDVHLDPLPHVLDPRRAATADAPLLFPDAGTNTAFSAHAGTDEATALDGAAVVVRSTQHIARLAPSPMEPHGILVRPDGDRLVVWASTQGVHTLRDAIATTLGMATDDVRVLAPAVGGAFGAKYHVNTDLLVVSAAARRAGRAVRWIETRTEHLLGASHGRGQHQEIAMGFRADGTITGLAATLVADGGAYPGLGAVMPNATTTMACGPYRIDRVCVDARGVVTNTSPTIAYRGAGRPEATAMLEQTLDRAAHLLGLDPVEIRRRNLLRADELPRTTATGLTIDSGDYLAALDLACERIGYTRRRARQRAAVVRRATVTGIGVAVYQDVTPFRLVTEFASVTVELGPADAPHVHLRAGTLSHGQNHTATYGAIARRVLALGDATVSLQDRDTDAVPRGVGSASARSTQIAGSAVHEAAVVVRAEARRVAAELLEAPLHDVELTARGFSVVGVPARVCSWTDVLVAHGPFTHAHDWTQPGSTVPYGVHAAVVELDPTTGAIELVQFVAVDDCGVVVDPVLVDGQQQGGAAQGIAAALFEAVEHDDMGTVRTASLADYLVPSAADLPVIETARTEVPTPRNPIGAKGIGQSGCIGAPAAVHNAVLDALAQLGAVPERLDPPFSPERVWRALQARR